MTKTILFSFVCTWLASWSLAADIETFVNGINKIYCKKLQIEKTLVPTKKAKYVRLRFIIS
jgi:hypothetical protein